MTDNPRRFEDTLGNGEYIDAPLPKGKIRRVYSAAAYEALRSERDHYQVAFLLAVGELSTNDQYRLMSPEMLASEFLKQAVRGE